MVISVIDDFPADAVIRFVWSHSSNCAMYVCAVVVAWLMSGSCVRMVRSSAYVVMIVLSVFGWGISAMKRLKRQGERIVPWGTPFLMRTRWEIWPFERTLAVLPVRKFAIHFLKLFSM